VAESNAEEKQEEKKGHTLSSGLIPRRCANQLNNNFIPESIVNTVPAGLLTCNIFAILPILPERNSGQSRAKTFALLTVAGQLVIYTQFPFNPSCEGT
jgi:hypothetical protein